MEQYFLPVFSLDWSGLLKKLQTVKGNYGVLAPISCPDSFLAEIRQLNKPFFIDSGVFETKQKPWHYRLHCEFKNSRWIRELRLVEESFLRQKIRDYLERCDHIAPDYVFALDIIGEPLLSLHLARLCWQEYWVKPRPYTLIGVVQVGYSLYNWYSPPVPQPDSFLPHYDSAKSFLSSLISVYREIGYEQIALGGLLQSDKTRASTGLKFGLSSEELDELLAWSRPEFVLGGLALSRLEVLKKHNVWADSTGWLWWDELYEPKRFKDRNPLQETIDLATISALN
jgi:hypothetical protein